MKSLLIALLLSWSFNLPVSSAEQLKGSQFKVESIAEQLLFVTIRIETEKTDATGKVIKGVGTGFIVDYRWADKQALFIVTNKHVINGAEKIRFFFVQSDGTNPLLGKVKNIELENVKAAFFGHPNNNIDLGIIPLAGVLENLQKKNWPIYYKSISTNLFSTPEQEKEFDAIEEVIFVGYPSGVFDTKNYIPVVRKGTTATPFSIDYMGLPLFLIDASVFPGSSGSPIFLLNKGAYSLRSGGTVVGSRFALLGVLSGGYGRQDDGTWDFTEIPTTIVPKIKTFQMIDLGVVIKSSAVIETIEAFLKSKGILKEKDEERTQSTN